MQSVTEEEVSPFPNRKSPDNTELTGEYKNVSDIPFRNQEDSDQPGMPAVSVIQAWVRGHPAEGPGAVQTSPDGWMQPQRNLDHIVLTHDIRLEAIKLLAAIFERDPYLDPFQRAEIESTIKTLDDARNREIADIAYKESGMQTPILDPVIPSQGRGP